MKKRKRYKKKKPLTQVATDGLGIYQMVLDHDPQAAPTYEKVTLNDDPPGCQRPEYVHCDEYIDDEKQPLCLRKFLRYKRWPAIYQLRAYRLGIKDPQLFANYGSRRVKVVMASRFGDVGITGDLTAECGYDVRVPVEALSLFSDGKEWRFE